MARLIDTSVFVAMERERIPLSVLAAESRGVPIGVASITASELLVGFHRSRSLLQRTRRREFVESVLQEFPVLAFDLDVARTHAELSVELSDGGRGIGAHDLIIAATALAGGFELLTHNVRHFERVPGLTVVIPTF